MPETRTERKRKEQPSENSDFATVIARLRALSAAAVPPVRLVEALLSFGSPIFQDALQGWLVLHFNPFCQAFFTAGLLV